MALQHEHDRDRDDNGHDHDLGDSCYWVVLGAANLAVFANIDRYCYLHNDLTDMVGLWKWERPFVFQKHVALITGLTLLVSCRCRRHCSSCSERGDLVVDNAIRPMAGGIGLAGGYEQQNADCNCNCYLYSGP